MKALVTGGAGFIGTNLIKKLIEQNLIKPKTKIGLNSFLVLIQKWRNDLKVKKIKRFLMVLNQSG